MTPTDSPTPIPTEEHPLQPFLPPHARLLMLGSFRPRKNAGAWISTTPNFINDMWRIMGYIFHGDRNWFVDERAKCFKKEMIVEFLLDKGIALYDTASAIRRLQDNAADKFLEVVTPTDLPRLLGQIPRWHGHRSPPDKKLPTRYAIPSIYRSPSSEASARS